MKQSIYRSLGFAAFGPSILLALSLSLFCLPTRAQTAELTPTVDKPAAREPKNASSFLLDATFSKLHFSAMLTPANPNFFMRSAANLRLTTGATFSPEYGFIDRMEAAFICLDTPFAEQVRLPVASLWHGRLKLDIVTTNLTTADFVWGLPGAGSLHNLNANGSGFLAVRTPKSDQVSGMHVTFHPHGSETQPQDDSLIHGLAHALRAGRELLQR